MIGTEMNKRGQKFVDDFTSDAMKPLGEEFLKGARIVNGHTIAAKYFDYGFLSDETSEK